MLRKKRYINPFAILEKASCRQAYASGRNAARRGYATNPHPPEAPEYLYWANGYLKGLEDRR